MHNKNASMLKNQYYTMGLLNSNDEVVDKLKELQIAVKDINNVVSQCERQKIELQQLVRDEMKGIRILLERIVDKLDNASLSKNIEPKELSPTPTYTIEAQKQEESRDFVVQTGVIENQPIKKMYFSAPDENGFESMNAIPDALSPKNLYVIETNDGRNGRFYPLSSRLQRLRSNANAFLFPLCEIIGDLDEANSIEIDSSEYGLVILENGVWRLEKKCKVRCI